MCKQSCCPGNDRGGLGAVVAIAIGLALACAAGAAIRFFEELLTIVAITAAVLGGLALATIAAILIVRYRRTPRAQSLMARSQVPHVASTAAHGWQVRQIEPGVFSCTGSQRQALTGGESAALYRAIRAALNAGDEVLIIDGKNIGHDRHAV